MKAAGACASLLFIVVLAHATNVSRQATGSQKFDPAVPVPVVKARDVASSTSLEVSLRNMAEKAVQTALQHNEIQSIVYFLGEEVGPRSRILIETILDDPTDAKLDLLLSYLAQPSLMNAGPILLYNIFPSAAGQGLLEPFKHFKNGLLKPETHPQTPLQIAIDHKTIMEKGMFYASARSAAKFGQVHMLEYLFQESAKWSPPHRVLGHAFLGAFEGNRLDMIELLRTKYVQDGSMSLENADLIVAAQHGQAEMIRYCLDKRASGEEGFTSLDVTSDNSRLLVAATTSVDGNEDTVVYILQSDLVFDPSVENYVVLNKACYKGYLETVKLLLGENEKATNGLLKAAPKWLKIDALAVARSWGKGNIVEFLQTQHGIHVTPCKDHLELKPFGIDPNLVLQGACIGNDVRKIRALLGETGEKFKYEGLDPKKIPSDVLKNTKYRVKREIESIWPDIKFDAKDGTDQVECAIAEESVEKIKTCYDKHGSGVSKVIIDVILDSPTQRKLNFYLRLLASWPQKTVLGHEEMLEGLETLKFDMFPSAAARGEVSTFLHLLHNRRDDIPTEQILRDSVRSAAQHSQIEMLSCIFTEAKNLPMRLLGHAFVGAFGSKSKNLMVDHLLKNYVIAKDMPLVNEDLLLAALFDQTEMIREFVVRTGAKEEGFQKLDLPYNSGQRLLEALEIGHEEMVIHILQSNLVFDLAAEHYVVLEYACSNGHLKTVKLLLGENEEATNGLLKVAPKWLKIDAFAKARFYGSDNVLEFLQTTHGIHVTPRNDYLWWKPFGIDPNIALMEACKSGKRATVERLLEKTDKGFVYEGINVTKLPFTVYETANPAIKALIQQMHPHLVFGRIGTSAGYSNQKDRLDPFSAEIEEPENLSSSWYWAVGLGLVVVFGVFGAYIYIARPFTRSARPITNLERMQPSRFIEIK